MFTTKTGATMIGGVGNEGVDEDFVAKSFEGIGAYILGRNMFGPSRGPWIDDGWTGWWGSNPTYHRPTLILTHHHRSSIEMEGGTTFHSVTAGVHDALAQASAAGNEAVRVVGGASRLREFLSDGLIDTMHIAIVPKLVGEGERIFEGRIPYKCVRTVPSGNVLHAEFERA